jgi:hypothetical protein
MRTKGEKPTWRSPQEGSTTSAYSVTSLPILPVCSLFSHPKRCSSLVAAGGVPLADPPQVTPSYHLLRAIDSGISTRLPFVCERSSPGAMMTRMKSQGELEAAIGAGINRFGVRLEDTRVMLSEGLTLSRGRIRSRHAHAIFGVPRRGGRSRFRRRSRSGLLRPASWVVQKSGQLPLFH